MLLLFSVAKFMVALGNEDWWHNMSVMAVVGSSSSGEYHDSFG